MQIFERCRRQPVLILRRRNATVGVIFGHFYSMQMQIQPSSSENKPKPVITAFCSTDLTKKKLTIENVFLTSKMKECFRFNLKVPTPTKGTYLKTFFHYLEEVSHLDEVRKAQADLMEIKKALHETGEEKRSLLRGLEKVRNEINTIYKDMKFTENRASEHYLELVKKEVELCIKEKDLQEYFTLRDEKEQRLFNMFSVAINELYEKEKLHTNFLKILGVVGTIFGSLITVFISFVGHYYNQNKMHLIKTDVENSILEQVLEKLDDLNDRLTPLEQKESWGSYLKRHTRWTYSWIIPPNK